MSPDCFVTSVESPSTDIVVNPPDSKWKAETMEYLERWAGTTLQCKEERMVIKTAFPHTSLMQLKGMVTAFLEGYYWYTNLPCFL